MGSSWTPTFHLFVRHEKGGPVSSGMGSKHLWLRGPCKWLLPQPLLFIRTCPQEMAFGWPTAALPVCHRPLGNPHSKPAKSSSLWPLPRHWVSTQADTWKARCQPKTLPRFLLQPMALGFRRSISRDLRLSIRACYSGAQNDIHLYSWDAPIPIRQSPQGSDTLGSGIYSSSIRSTCRSYGLRPCLPT